MEGEASTSSLMKQVSATQEMIDKNLYRIGAVERNLKSKQMSHEERENLEKELEEIKAILAENESALKALHGENRKTASVALLAVAIVFGIYFAYTFLMR